MTDILKARRNVAFRRAFLFGFQLCAVFFANVER